MLSSWNSSEWLWFSSSDSISRGEPTSKAGFVNMQRHFAHVENTPAFQQHWISSKGSNQILSPQPSLASQDTHLSSPAHPQKSGCDKPYGRSLSCSWVHQWWTASPHCSWSHPGRFPQGFGSLLTARLPSAHAELWKDVPWSEEQRETWQTRQWQSKPS